MGMDLTFRAGKRSFSRRISRADWELLKTLRTFASSEVALLCDVPDMDTTLYVVRAELLTACAHLLRVIQENTKSLPHTYQFSREPHIKMFSTGGKSGLQFPGDDKYFYSVQAGFNECTLERWGVKRGLGVMLETRDIRDLSELVTSNMGTIRIRKTRAKTDVKRMLVDLVVFLNELDAQEITKCMG
jgi:hypothetical protein